MMQLVLTVMAIGLAALLAVGGINYFSTDIGVRVEVSQSLLAQHSAIAGAISSYKTANNGFVPARLTSVAGYLPEGEIPVFPVSGQPFKWDIAEEGGVDFLCLHRDGGTPGEGVMQGIVSFARTKAQRHPGSVNYGTDCDDALSPDGPEDTDGVYDGKSGLSVDFIETYPEAAIVIKGY